MPPAPLLGGCNLANGLGVGEPACVASSGALEGEAVGVKARVAELSLRANGEGREGLTMERESGDAEAKGDS